MCSRACRHVRNIAINKYSMCGSAGDTLVRKKSHKSGTIHFDEEVRQLRAGSAHTRIPIYPYFLLLIKNRWKPVFNTERMT